MDVGTVPKDLEVVALPRRAVPKAWIPDERHHDSAAIHQINRQSFDGNLRGNAVTVAGDVWLLGPHRLLCGDATQMADVERVMAGGLADSNHPPAKPEALRLLAPQRGLIAIDKTPARPKRGRWVSAFQAASNYSPAITSNPRGWPNQTPGNVKLLLPPRQSRGISYFGLARRWEAFTGSQAK